MATQLRKNTAKKKAPRQKNIRKNSTKTSSYKKHIIIYFGVFLMISLVAFGYFLGQNERNAASVKSSSIKKETSVAKTLEEHFSKVKTKIPEQKVKKETPVSVSADAKSEMIPKEESPLKAFEKKTAQGESENTKTVALAYRAKKPKLVIIIDDVSSAKQLARIRSLPIKVTPSIFPPYELSKSNNRLAQGLDHYMIHLPMQSGKVYDNQYATLKVTDSRKKIEARVKELRRLFPAARYVNNHTGSVFTDNYNAMKILYTALRNEGFVFVDSRTIGTTKVPKIAHAAGDAYVARDMFIDNIQNISYIRTQLKQGVQKAKKNGYAIVIGHPHSVTMKAIAGSKDIFEEVELVYIDEIYRKRE